MIAGGLAVVAIGVFASARLSARAESQASIHHRTAAAGEVAPSAAAAGAVPGPAPHSRAVDVHSSGLPAGLVPGACVEFDPTGPDLHRTVFVDPGHGGPDPGAVVGALQEKSLTLAVALQLTEMLRADGFKVVLSRTTDTSVARLAGSQVQQGAITNSGVHLDTMARIACADAAGADALVGIHFNAFDDPGVGGAETLYDDARPFAAENLRLAQLVQSGLLACFGKGGWTVDDRGVLTDAETGAAGLTAAADAYGRLMELGPEKPGWNDQPSSMPGVIVEPLFITDPVEAQLASGAEGQRAIAAGIEQGLAAFLLSRLASPPPR